MKMKVFETPVYPEIEVVAKTVDSVTGTIDRKPIGRCLLTTEAVDKKYQVVDGDGTELAHVESLAEGESVELFVALVGDIKSLASKKFYTGFKAANRENPEVKDLFTDECDKIDALVAMAERMCADHPECDNQWKLVDKDGNRWFLRKICKSLRANGKID